LPSRDIAVIGASADGVQTLEELVRSLPADLPAALVVAALRKRSAERAIQGGLVGLATTYERQASDLIERAHTIRRVLERPIEHPADEAEVPAGEGGEA
jgi:hypothetical protein